MIRTTPWLCAAIPLATAIAAPAQPPARAAAIVDDLTACRTIADSTARLACYDTNAARLASATARRDVVIVDREEMRRTRRSLFGFALPRIALFGERGPTDSSDVDDTAPREEITELETTITQVRSLGYDKYQLTLAEGGTWRSTEPWAGAKLPAVGSHITVHRASLGSYTFKLPGGRAVRGMRVG